MPPPSSAISDSTTVHSAPWQQESEMVEVEMSAHRHLTAACRAGAGAGTAPGRAPQKPARITSDSMT